MCQSRRLSARASAAAMTGASQFTTAGNQGIAAIGATASAKLVSGPVSAACVRCLKAPSAAW